MKNTPTLILIVVITLVAILINLPSTTGFELGSYQKTIETQLGLDLVGGVQILLEADGVNPTAEQMNTARQVVENRVAGGLGATEATVQVVGDNRISVELPGEQDPQKAMNILKGTGLLEFVDMSSISQTEAGSLIGQAIKTDYGLSGNLPVITSTALTDQIWPSAMTGTALADAGVTTDQAGKYEISLTFTSDGTKQFASFTSDHVGDVLAIVLDKVVLSVPTINSALTDGQAVIQGSFTYEEANTLAIQLRYGSLPVPLKVVETRSVGPSLGQDSLQKSLIAGAIGAVIVVLFMSLFYRLPGLIAVLALMIYALITFALYRYIPITLTLPGIAGFLLSTGSALDANILIFERLKEELRAGKSLPVAIRQGWQRALPSIIDSNAATLITCAILYIFGSQSGATIVIGFAFTLAVGVVVSLFTSLVVTRTFMNSIFDRFEPKNMETWFGI